MFAFEERETDEFFLYVLRFFFFLFVFFLLIDQTHLSWEKMCKESKSRDSVRQMESDDFLYQAFKENMN